MDATQKKRRTAFKARWPATPILIVLGAVGISHAQSLRAQFKEILAPSIAQTAVAENLVFQLDGIQVRVNSGYLGWGAPADGRPTALVVVGRGALQIALPDQIERQQVKLFTGSADLQFDFKAAVFRFADAGRLRAVLGGQARFRGGYGQAELEKVLGNRERVADGSSRAAPVRILDALSDGTAPPPWAADLLFAQFQRYDGSWVHVDLDPLDQQPLRVYTVNTRAVPPPALQTMAVRSTVERFQDTWAQLSPACVGSYPAPWVMRSYSIHISLSDSPTLRLNEVLALSSRAGHRGIFLRLDGKYRVLTAHALGQPIEFLQSRDPANRAPASYAGNWLYLCWPKGLNPGAEEVVSLELERKDAFSVAPRGNFHILHWPDQAWYPVVPFGGATRRAFFHAAVCASGLARQQGVVFAHWGSGGEHLPMTGFGWLVGGSSPNLQVSLPGGRSMAITGLWNGLASPKDVAHDVVGQYQEALGFFTLAFGALPLHSLAMPETSGLGGGFSPVTGRWIVRAPAELNNLPSSGPLPAPRSGLALRDAPSWPGMLSPAAYWASAASGLIGGKQSSALLPSRIYLTDMAPARGLAHQWWGDWVGFASYQDSWLSEALTSGSAMLFAQHQFGNRTASDLRADWMHELTAKDAFGRVPNDLGSLALGPRLASSLDPAGYDIIAEDKGGYVIEMLRAMMGEARFRAAMHDLTKTYGNHNISVAEFERLMAAHMSPVMDLDHNGSLAWFFDEYVSHPAIPTLSVSWNQSGKNVEVAITNPEHWRGLLPLYLYQNATHTQRTLIPVNGTDARATLHAPFVPTRIAADPFHEMLLKVVNSKQSTVNGRQ